MQVLLSAKEYDIALEESAKFMNQFPDYIEMIVLHCVLSKYILPSDEASIYNNSIMLLEIYYFYIAFLMILLINNYVLLK